MIPGSSVRNGCASEESAAALPITDSPWVFDEYRVHGKARCRSGPRGGDGIPERTGILAGRRTREQLILSAALARAAR